MFARIAFICMGDSSDPSVRRSERINKSKRPHHLRDFIVEECEEPIAKSPRIGEPKSTIDLSQVTIQSESEEMSLQNIEQLIVELTASQKETSDKIDTKHEDLVNILNSTKEELNGKVAELTTKIDVLQQRLNTAPDKPNGNGSQEEHPVAFNVNIEPPEVPIGRSGSTLSINSVESVELITRQISQSISSALGSHKKLISLPKFNGDADKWPQFFAQFERTTSREQYTTEDNVTRLEQALEGRAKDLVSSLLIHHTNVPRIMERLRSRFGMPEQLVDTQLIAIRKFEAIAEDQLHRIVPFADKVMNLKNFLESAGCEDHLSSPSLLKELEAKLPYRERITWGGYSMSLRPPTVKEFSDWLIILADQIHRINLKDGSDQKKKTKLLMHLSEDQSTCCLCDDRHGLERCRRFSEMCYDDKWFTAKKHKLCFCCLEPMHHLYQCSSKAPCGINGCKAMHHKMLHNETSNKPMNPDATIFNPTTMFSCQNRSRSVLFKILPVNVSGPKGTVQTFALVDDGSSVTLMNRDIAEKIGAAGTKGNLRLRWFGNIGSNEEVLVTNVKIGGAFNGAKNFPMSNVHVVSDLKLPNQTLDINKLHPKFHSMKRLPIQEFSNVTPTILIGLDNAHLGVNRDKPRSTLSGPIVCMTKLGYVVYGPTDQPVMETPEAVAYLANSNDDNEDLHELVKLHFSTEEFGTNNSKCLKSKDEERGNEILESTTKKLHGRFESGLLWKEKVQCFPNNLPMAIKRLESCERKMARDKEYKDAYMKTMAEYFIKGYAKVLSSEEISNPKGPVWYLPHFGIINPIKSKFRLVFDAAAEYNGVSLNSKLLSGADTNQPLIKILSQFREKRFAVCADIREMFHQIQIREQDKDAQRFVFRDDPKKPVNICRMEVMTFGSTCSPATAQHVKNLNAKNFMEENATAAQAIINKHYVDDYVDCFSTEEEAIQISLEVRRIHKEAGFELRGFTSNSEKVSVALCEERLPTDSGKRNMDNGAPNDKILGLSWNVKKDCFTFDIRLHKINPKISEGSRYPTKREYLSILMSVFDPFGFIADFMISMKILLQRIWKTGIGWDDIIPEEYQPAWSSWIHELKKCQAFQIPRCMSNDMFQAESIEWHTMVDASESAFAAVCYVRLIFSNGSAALCFVAGKTKAAPLKHLSVPRLELQAALLGVRLATTFRELQTFKVDKQFYWSDSKTVLFWIKDEKRRYRQFVANRVSEILDSSSASDWRWVSSQNNVADDATRLSFSPTFKEQSRWIAGPDWLQKGEWPNQPVELQTDLVSDEVLPDNATRILLHVSTPLLNLSNYSDWLKLRRHLAWLLRFVDYIRQKKKASRTSNLLASELQRSEMFLCRLVQRECYSDEFEALTRGKTISRKSSLFRMLPYLDEEHVMRVFGRIDNAPNLPLFTKRPIILPKYHHLTKLIVQSYHQSCAHQFDDMIVAEVRRKYWISGIKVLVKQIKRSCNACKIFNARPEQPLMGQLPYERLTPFVRPFSHTGVDYFGPVTISIGRRQEKRWVALFTCLTIRAVHVEISQDLSSDAFILCLKNFMNLRGVPTVLYSDNGSNFVGAKNEIIRSAEFVGQCGIQNATSEKGIKWKFNNPGDPAAGGCWERLVQAIKRVLKRIMKDVSPRVETLRSFLIEAANIVNSRPLTHVPISSEEEDPLTPNSFLLGCPNSIQTPGPTDEKLWCLRKQWRILNGLKNHFWRKWINEYLPDLTRRSKNFERVDPLKCGDIVIICDEDVAPRNWLKGMIVEVCEAKDGQVRSVIVRANGKHIKRSASKLAKLDISNPVNDEELLGEGCHFGNSTSCSLTENNSNNTKLSVV